jgi:integrase
MFAAKLQYLLNHPEQLRSFVDRPVAVERQTPTLELAADKMKQEYTVNGTWKDGTAYKNRSQLQKIINLLGSSRPVHSLQLSDLENLKDSLLYKVRNTDELFGPDSVARDDVRPEDVICGETIHRYLNLLKHFIRYCESSNWLPHSLPLHEVKLSSLSPQLPHYKTFTQPELAGIFNSRVYTTKATENFRWIPYSYCFWMPLLAAFTGARPGELCQLYAGDVFQAGGVAVIHVSDQGPEQRLKTQFSARDIPVHPKLIEFGFLDFVEMRLKEGGRYRPLFPELSYDKKHGFARTASRWFSGQGADDHGYLAACGLYKGQGACLYSFRHTFIDILRNTLGVQEMMIKKLVGHGTKHDVTINYGQEFSLSRRHQKIAEVDLGIDLSHVSWESYQQLQQCKPCCHKDKRGPVSTRRR